MTHELTPEDLEGEDTSWYLTSMHPDDTKYVAQTMHSNGASDEEIGRTILKHLHDEGREGNVCRIFLVTHTDTSDRKGVVACVPNHGGVFDPLLPGIDNDKDIRVKTYGLPDHKKIRDLAREAVIERGLNEDRYELTYEGQ